jgi:hypothetical protein
LRMMYLKLLFITVFTSNYSLENAIVSSEACIHFCTLEYNCLFLRYIYIDDIRYRVLICSIFV